MEWIFTIGKFIALVAGVAAVTSGLLGLSLYDKWAKAHKSEPQSIPAIYARASASSITEAHPSRHRHIIIAALAFGLLIGLIFVAIAWGPFDNLANTTMMSLGGVLALVAYLHLGRSQKNRTG